MPVSRDHDNRTEGQVLMLSEAYSMTGWMGQDRTRLPKRRNQPAGLIFPIMDEPKDVCSAAGRCSVACGLPRSRTARCSG